MDRRSEGRLALDLPGTYRIAEGEARAMFFSALSSKGCRLEARGAGLAVGDRVTLSLGPIGPIGGMLRWLRDPFAGVEFDSALDTAIVAYFAAFIEDAA